MMNEREEALKDLKEQLDRIKENNRQQIHLITLMADDYSAYAEDVAKLIVNHIKESPSELKLIGIYVMDSIIKFSGDTVDKYRRLFGNEIVKLFVDTFEKAPIAHRQNLFKVRATWQPFFLKSKLFDLDNEVQKLDKSWPIFKQSTVGIPIVSTSKPAATPPVATPAAPVKPVTVLPPVSSLPRIPKKEPKSDESTVPPAASTSASLRTSVPSKSSLSSKAVAASPSATLKPRDPRQKQVVSEKKPILKQAAATVINKKEPAFENSSVATSTIITSSKSAASTIQQPAFASKTVKPGKISPSKTRDPRRNHDLPLKKPVSKQSGAGITILPSSKFVPTSTASATGKPATTTTSKPIPQSTAVKREPLRRHSDVPKKKRRIEEPLPVQPTAAPGAHAFLPPPIVTADPFTMPPQPSVSPLGAILPPQVKTEVDDSWRSTSSNQPIFNQPPPAMISPPTAGISIITNETPKVGSASNNRIFVDGRVYEVFYLNNEAVIERNGLPHRIFFTGSTRDVLVDGQPFKLGFDEVIMVHIDGIPHPIRFGAPSRELYVGDHPFRGAFGGPPMVANINGRRHEFRLCGPPPEVRIDQDPCYELSRHMNAARGPQIDKPKPTETLGKQDVLALLQKIKQHGILNKPLTISKDDTKASSVAQKPSPPGARIDLGVAREVSAPSSLKDFHIGTLMVRYSDVIEMLHRTRTACPHCGIGFNETNSEAYQRHIDMHVQDLLRTKETGKSRARLWYMGKENWLHFDEISEVQRQPTTELQKGSADEGCSAMSDKFVSSPSDAIATTSLNKVCTVCHEKFNEYYDNDEEEWRFQDCVVKGNIAIHRYCVEQMEDGNDNNGNFGIKQEIAQKQTAFPV